MKNMDSLLSEQKLKEFLMDIRCLDELSRWANPTNIFNVLKLARTEIRHSNMLAWLMDANESHGLGDLFIRELMNPFVADKENSIDWLMLDYTNCSVRREWRNIDILIFSEAEKKMIVIENKIDSGEHGNQLETYHNRLSKDSHFSAYDAIYIYLTPDGRYPSIPEIWQVLDYSTLIEVLARVREKQKIRLDAQVLIDNYIDIVRREIVKDSELIEVCQKIYRKHRVALDLLFANRPDEKGDVKTMLVSELNKQGKTIHHIEKKSGVLFRTDFMSKILKDDMYGYYFFVFDENNGQSVKIRFQFFLESSDVPPAYFQHMKNLTMIFDKDATKTSFTQKALFSQKFSFSFECDDPERELSNIVKTCLETCSKLEHRIKESDFYKGVDIDSLSISDE